MPTQTAQQIIATARRNAAALPSEQAAARERRNTARKAARKAREAAKPVRAARELPPIDGAHWAKRRYGSNWLYPAVQLTSPHAARIVAQWAPRTTRYIETPPCGACTCGTAGVDLNPFSHKKAGTLCAQSMGYE